MVFLGPWDSIILSSPISKTKHVYSKGPAIHPEGFSRFPAPSPKCHEPTQGGPSRSRTGEGGSGFPSLPVSLDLWLLSGRLTSPLLNEGVVTGL